MQVLLVNGSVRKNGSTAAALSLLEDYFGSITFSVGFRIPRIALSTGIEDFEEEIVVVWVAVPLPSQGLDFVVDALDFTGRDIVGGVCDNALKVAV